MTHGTEHLEQGDSDALVMDTAIRCMGSLQLGKAGFSGMITL